MSRVLHVFIIIGALLPTCSHAQNCGFKPYAQWGCKIGRCVNGKWEQVCGESDLNSKSDNHLIAGPKVADIAGALESRQRMLENHESEKNKVSGSQNNSNFQYNLLAFEELRKTNKETARAMMAGIGLGLFTANTILSYKESPRLYCQPSSLSLNAENYMQIYEAKLEKNREEFSSFKNIHAGEVLLLGLIESFPCQK